MYNESSCRSCGREVTAILRCKFCEETDSWICKGCNITVHRLHIHNVNIFNTKSSTNTIELFK